MRRKITVALTPAQAKALIRLAQQDYRSGMTSIAAAQRAVKIMQEALRDQRTD